MQSKYSTMSLRAKRGNPFATGLLHTLPQWLRMASRACALAMTLAFNSATAFEPFILADLGIGKINGYIQTPKGGSFNTTSLDRPSFADVNLTWDHFYNLGGGFTVNDYLFKINYLHLNPEGADRLSSDLLTHTQFIHQNQLFAMNVHFDWYYLELGKSFWFFQNQWQITPLVDLNWIKYDYQFSAYPLQSMRTFSMINVSVGAKAERHFSTHWSGYLQGKFSIPASNLQLYTLTAGINYCVQVAKHVAIVPTLAMGVMQLDYEDDQPVPNHIRYTNWPFAKMGIQINFN